ncbi:MAG: IS30 family transposase [Bacilli bacterium]|nr:IS30 family transposase [Bacilli bacterium]
MNHLNYTTKQRNFKQLTKINRIQIQTLLDQGFSQSTIAQIIGVHRSTISREIKRGSVTTMDTYLKKTTNYEAEAAQNLSNKRNLNSRKKPKYLGHEDLLDKISRIVKKKKYSFDIIAGRMKLKNHEITFSTQTLYNYYHKNLLKISDFHLPNYGTHKSTKRVRRANISHKRINMRPKEVNERTEPMHWEMDSVVSGRNQGPALLVLSERYTRTELIYKLDNKTSDNVIATLDKIHDKVNDDFKVFFKSITTDNGSEFLNYEGIEKNQRTTQYFANPYKSCDRATNENLNREIRRFFPKGTKFNNVSENKIKNVQNWMNNKPRKILGYHTPLELMEKVCPKFAKMLAA